MGGKGIRTSETKCSFHPFTIALKTQYRRQSTSVSAGSSFSLLFLLSLWLLLLQPNCQTITGASKRKDEKKGKKNKETRKGNRSQGPAKISSHSSRIACPRCNTGIKRRGQRRKTVRRQQRPREEYELMPSRRENKQRQTLSYSNRCRVLESSQFGNWRK